MAGGNYSISALPLTYPLIESRAKELSFKTGADYNYILESYKSNYSENKSCFEIEFIIVETQKANDLSLWKFNLVDYNNIKHELKLVSMDNLVQSIVGRGFRKIPQWMRKGLICSESKMSLSRGFELGIIPNYVNWPFSDHLSMTWVVLSPESKKPGNYKKKIQRYRGW